MNATERARLRREIGGEPTPPPAGRVELCAVCWWMGYAYRDQAGTWRVGPHRRVSTNNLICPGAHQPPVPPVPLAAPGAPTTSRRS